MTMLKLTIETTDRKLSANIQRAYDLALEESTFESFLIKFNYHLSPLLITGMCGSHIWISNKNNFQRAAIIIL